MRVSVYLQWVISYGMTSFNSGDSAAESLQEAAEGANKEERYFFAMKVVFCT